MHLIYRNSCSNRLQVPVCNINFDVHLQSTTIHNCNLCHPFRCLQFVNSFVNLFTIVYLNLTFALSYALVSFGQLWSALASFGVGGKDVVNFPRVLVATTATVGPEGWWCPTNPTNNRFFGTSFGVHLCQVAAADTTDDRRSRPTQPPTTAFVTGGVGVVVGR